MKTHITLGIDPGIANTGLAIVEANGTRYSLVTAETIKPKPCDDTGKRLSIIHDEINDTLDSQGITGIAIERVFHNKNITSSLTTGAVIGLVHLIAHRKTDSKPSVRNTNKITSRSRRSLVCFVWLSGDAKQFQRIHVTPTFTKEINRKNILCQPLKNGIISPRKQQKKVIR